MSIVVHPPTPSPALDRIRAAIVHCRHAGIAVHVADLGVVESHRSGALTWELAGPLVVNPIGALLIAFQPPALDPYDAAVIALGCEVTTVAGIRDGLDNKRPTVAGWAYADGYAVGLQLRAELRAAPPALRVVS